MRSLAGRAAEFGVEAEPAATNMKGVQDRKRAMVEGLRQLHLDRYRASGAELIMGDACFTAPRTVNVQLAEGGARRISGDRVFLNLGTHATVPDLPGLTAAEPDNHVELLDLDRLPEHLVVIGGGSVGLELAQAMRRFGSHVTVIERARNWAGSEDPDVAAAVLELFRDEGTTVLLQNPGPESRGEIRARGTRARPRTEPPAKELSPARILVIAVGRTPNTAGIGLAGVERTEAGYLKVNERLATTADRVWAVGECAGSPQFTHAAFDDFRVVRSSLNGGTRSTAGRLVPFCRIPRPGTGQGSSQRVGGQARRHQVPPADHARVPRSCAPGPCPSRAGS